MNYQYRGFGVPGVGRKRGLGEDLVIAPYASLLATKVVPQAVLKNVNALRSLGMMGQYGFYESVDYTRARLPLGRDYAIVKSYMVHHQGMILLALTNVLRDDAHTARFHADRRIETVELLLQERIPTGAPIEEVSEQALRGERNSIEPVVIAPWEPTTTTPLPQVHYLSNGEYSVMVTASGGGYSRWHDMALTRWRADTTLDNWGSWIYVQDLDSEELWSLTDQPFAASGTASRVNFYPHEAQFTRRTEDLVFQLEVAVAPDDPVEIRRVVIINHGETLRHLRLSSCAEVVLAPQDVDRRHPAFNKMFIESEFVADLAPQTASAPQTAFGPTGSGDAADGEPAESARSNPNPVLPSQDRPRVPALVFWRRPRSSEEPVPAMGHALLTAELAAPSEARSVAYETDRARFLGRGRTYRAPQALVGEGQDPETIGSRTGTTLDPVMALGEDLTLAPHATVTVAYITAAGEGSSTSAAREAVLSLLLRYRTLPRVEQALESARSQSEKELRDLNLVSEDVARIGLLLSALIYPYPEMRAAQEVLTSNRLGQSGLWPHAISGDYPILLVRLRQKEDLALVREVIRAHTYWRHRDLKIDVVLFNEKDVGYEQELNQQLRQLLHRSGSDAWVNTRGGIFVINAGRLDQASRTLLLTAARVVFSGEAGGFEEQLQALKRQRTWLPALVPSRPTETQTATEGRSEFVAPVERPGDLRFDNGYGGFSPDGRAYLIYLGEDASRANGARSSPAEDTPIPDRTPAPWINVIANEDFGFFVSESGGGYTWAANSGENRLTPWRNDPLSPEPGEVLYLRDEATADVWTPTPQPAGTSRPYLVRHEPGRTTFTHHSHGLLQRVELFVAPDAPVKIVRLHLENASDRPRRITATYYAAWVLGVDRDTMQQYVVSEYDDETGAILARNAYNAEFGSRVAFLASDRRSHGLTADRTEFLGPGGDLRRPAALNRVGLSGSFGPGLDPCGALQVHLDLEEGTATQVIFLLGQGADRGAALDLVARFQDTAEVAATADAVTAFWDGVLDTITVSTPDASMNTVLRWVLYQALSCRVWGRSALYQSSGAFGFRDQLQDVMALLHARPDLARAHILRAAAHQFEAGDVLHWWHPPSGRGVRTRISDDLLWLPYVTAEYVKATGDRAILDEEVPFRQGEPLGNGEEERYAHYE
ncbi:MAG: hypothetical protein JXC32_10970, partial [Anaerolineae bacterium]|nr:hypothetical protein [Anaerolineae bacterium]